MRTHFAVCCIALSLTTPAMAQETGPGGTVTKWADAFTSHSTDAVVAVYTSDALIFGNRSKTLGEGREAVRAYFKSIAAGNSVECSQSMVVTTGPSSAFATGICNFVVKRDGKPVASPSRFSMVLVQENGQWLIKHHHVSRVPE